MNIIVLIKEVPDMEKVKFDREKGVIDRSSASTQINPFDLNALQTAVNIREKVGGEVKAISMGPSRAEDSLKESIARGADDALLLTDRAFAGSDTWATSFTLAKAIEKINNYDLIICGEMTVDGDTAQVGPQVAEFLNIPHVAFVWDIEDIKDNKIIVKSDLWDGTYLNEITYPGLITVSKDINNPQLPSLKDKMKARKAEIEKWGLNDLIDENLSDEDFGLSGSLTKVKDIKVPPISKRKSKIWEDDYDEALDSLTKLLKEKRRI